MSRKPKSATQVDSKLLKINNKSNKIQKTTNDSIEALLPQDCNNSLVLSKVFEQMKFKELVNINTVCQKWNQLINPMIYKSLMITRYRYVANNYHDKNLSKEDKLANEIKACIDNNTKHKHLVQDFKLHSRLPPTLAQEFFGTFCYLSKLTIYNFSPSQDFILTCLKPMKYLKELILDELKIVEIKKDQSVFEPVQLPLSLTKLKISNLKFTKDPKLLKQTLCSHTNLEEFTSIGSNDSTLLAPFHTHYPTLQKFRLNHYLSCSISHTCNIIESNPQLTHLQLESDELNSDIVTSINSHLKNLTELTLRGSQSIEAYAPTDVRFTQPMKLIKLTLYWNELTPASFDSILSNLPQLKDLHISFGYKYTPWTSIIKQRCKNLTQLTYKVNHSWRIRSDEFKLFCQFFEIEFLPNQYQFSQTLKSLNFSEFDISKLKPEHLDQFPNLQMISFNHVDYSNIGQIQDFTLLSTQLNGWKLKIIRNTLNFSGFLYKPNTKITPINYEDFQNWY